MRWLSFILFVGLMLTLQSVGSPGVALLGVRPDWLLVIVVFFALHAPPRDALLSAWVLGMSADLLSIERLGLIAFSYTCVAAVLVTFREFLFCRRWLTQIIVTLAAGVFVQGVWVVYRHAMYDVSESIVVDLAVGLIPAALYTAVWAPLAHKLLLPCSSILGLPRPRYTYAG